jgi:hypothetical protein
MDSSCKAPLTHKVTHLAFVIAVALSLLSSAHAQVTVTIDHNGAGTGNFKFNNVPTPAKEDTGARARWQLLVGELDPNGADFSALNDGLLPTSQDQPTANLFFSAGSSGGRFRMDLGKMVEIAQVNSYSWHHNSRGPQVYLLYASDGASPKFNADPKGYVDPTTAGWKLLTIVDTRQKYGRMGGQYGVSVTGVNGMLGNFRYLLFDTVATETDNDWGNTFYSEIDVIEKLPK